VLRLLDIFLPRISLGKVVSPGSAQSTSAASTGFPYVKRDLVRLLGILVHDSRPIQDRVRECGGVPIVMNMCVIDDANPCETSLL
jgi:ataxin-10